MIEDMNKALVGVKYLEKPVQEALQEVASKYTGQDSEKYVNQFSAWLTHHM